MTLAKNEALLEALAERVASKLRAELTHIAALVQRPIEGRPAEGIAAATPLETSDLSETLTGIGRGER